jgi:hypothetical protein
MIEGSGAGSIPLTSGSGSGSPKNMWIRWIRIRNSIKKGAYLKGTVSRDFRLLVFFADQVPPLTPVANLLPVSTTLAKLVAKFAAGVADTGGKFAAGVVDTGGNFATTGVVETGGAPLLANISANFRKNSKRS